MRPSKFRVLLDIATSPGATGLKFIGFFRIGAHLECKNVRFNFEKFSWRNARRARMGVRHQYLVQCMQAGYFSTPLHGWPGGVARRQLARRRSDVVRRGSMIHRHLAEGLSAPRYGVSCGYTAGCHSGMPGNLARMWMGQTI